MTKRETIDYSFAKFENVDDFFRYNLLAEEPTKAVFYEIDEISYKDGTYVALKFTSIVNKTSCNTVVKHATEVDAENMLEGIQNDYREMNFFEGIIYPYHTYNKSRD